MEENKMTNAALENLFIPLLCYNSSNNTVEEILMTIEKLKQQTLELDDKLVFEAYVAEKDPIQKAFLKSVMTFKMQTKQQELINSEEFVL